MKRIACLAAAAIIAVAASADRAWAVTSAIPTAGIAVTSFVVGAAAATESALEETRSKWNRKLLGFGSILLMGIDPDPATYLSGTTVIAYPEELLRFEQLTWFGPFSDQSTGDTGPVAGPGAVERSGFFEDVQVFEAQGPNPALTFNSAAADGVLTVSWSAVPGIEADAESVNIFGAVFSSISDVDLQFAITPPGSALANLSQSTAVQALACIPPGETEPRSCGYPNEPIGFRVTQVPEPSSYALMLFGLLAVGFAIRRRRFGATA